MGLFLHYCRRGKIEVMEDGLSWGHEVATLLLLGRRPSVSPLLRHHSLTHLPPSLGWLVRRVAGRGSGWVVYDVWVRISEVYETGKASLCHLLTFFCSIAVLRLVTPLLRSLCLSVWPGDDYQVKLMESFVSTQFIMMLFVAFTANYVKPASKDTTLRRSREKKCH